MFLYLKKYFSLNRKRFYLTFGFFTKHITQETKKCSYTSYEWKCSDRKSCGALEWVAERVCRTRNTPWRAALSPLCDCFTEEKTVFSYPASFTLMLLQSDEKSHFTFVSKRENTLFCSLSKLIDSDFLRTYKFFFFATANYHLIRKHEQTDWWLCKAPVSLNSERWSN